MLFIYPLTSRRTRSMRGVFGEKQNILSIFVWTATSFSLLRKQCFGDKFGDKTYFLHQVWYITHLHNTQTKSFTIVITISNLICDRWISRTTCQIELKIETCVYKDTDTTNPLTGSATVVYNRFGCELKFR